MAEPRHFGIRFPNVGPRRLGFVGITGVHYLIQEDFSDPFAAGSVNGTVAPGTGTVAQRTRTVVDTASKLSISSNLLQLVANSSYGNPGLWFGAFTRTAGRMLGVKLTNPTASNAFLGGWDSNQTTVPAYGESFAASAVLRSQLSGGASIVVGTWDPATTYYVVVVQRATGIFHFIKGGAFADWTLLYVAPGGNDATLFPAATTFDGNSAIDQMYVPEELWLPTPLLSDGFSAAVSDGLGHAEGVAGGLGSGGAGKTWVSDLGTWGVSGGVASCSVLDGSGVGIRTTDVGETDVWFEMEITRSGGNIGGVLRYVDVNNYIYFYHDGTNIKINKVIGGVDSSVLSAALAYSAGGTLAVNMIGTIIRVFHNNTQVSPFFWTIADAPAGTKVGLYTTDTGNTFDDAFCYPIGTGGEHSLSRFFQ